MTTVLLDLKHCYLFVIEDSVIFVLMVAKQSKICLFCYLMFRTLKVWAFELECYVIKQ